MRHAQSERTNVCDALEAVGATAPTLCEGWDARTLAAHLWLRENEVLTAAGVAFKPLAGRAERRMSELRDELAFEELIGLLRQGPPRFSLYRLPGVDEALNAVEFLIHGMDVRRANDLPEPSRPDGFDDWAWRQLRGLAWLLFRPVKTGLVLEWEARPDQTLRVRPGSRTVTVVAPPLELLLYGFGRRSAARVRLLGDPATLDELAATSFAR